MKYTNYSGGANGSDSIFETEGVKYGVTNGWCFLYHSIESKWKKLTYLY